MERKDAFRIMSQRVPVDRWFATGSSKIFRYFRCFHVGAGVIHGHQWVSSTIWDLKDELNVFYCTNIEMQIEECQ